MSYINYNNKYLIVKEKTLFERNISLKTDKQKINFFCQSINEI